MYKLLKPLLFLLNPESAHKVIIDLLKFLKYIPFSGAILRFFYSYNKTNEKLEREVFGLKFKHPVGLAAGFDKNGEYYNEISNFGFSFIEIGSVTPESQPGNPKPRSFRLPKDEALINRMGINNKGVKSVVSSIQKNKPKVIIGGNISKNTSTKNEDSAKDYEKTFSLLYDYVDYFALNVSCPNVKDLRKLQDIEILSGIIDRLLELRRYYDDYRPILLKLSPDIPKDNLDEIIDLVLTSGLDGVIATNTTTERESLGLKSDKSKITAIGDGGLSGAPLFPKSLEMVRYISQKTKGLLPIIAVGGIMTPQNAKEMLDAGASLIQIYSGFIYKGPALAKKIVKYLANNQ